MAPFMKHDLDRKYKRWRRGKSTKASAAVANNNSEGSGTTSGKGSLKQQLRGKERLLERLEHQQPQEGPMKSSLELLDKLREEIQKIRLEMERKQTLEKERRHAVKSHGTRFLERQRLTKMERAVKVGRGSHNPHGSSSSGRDKEKELQKIALDMVYVAYFPHEVKYQPLFHKGVRVVDDRRALVKRAKTRQRILQNLQTMDDHTKSKVNWISPEQYQRLPKVEWTVELERQTFGERTTDGSRHKETFTISNDDRFQTDVVNEQHAVLLAAADQIEAELDQDLELRTTRVQESQKDHVDSSSSSSEEDDDRDQHDAADTKCHNDLITEEKNAKTNLRLPNEKPKKNRFKSTKRDEQEEHSASSSSSSSSSGNDSSGDDNAEIPKTDDAKGSAATAKRRANDYDNDKMEEEDNTSNYNENGDDDDDDDFLVPAFEEDINAFAKPNKEKVDAIPGRTHDKSKGWATQRQRPGQFKRRRVRK